LAAAGLALAEEWAAAQELVEVPEWEVLALALALVLASMFPGSRRKR